MKMFHKPLSCHLYTKLVVNGKRIMTNALVSFSTVCMHDARRSRCNEWDFRATFFPVLLETMPRSLSWTGHRSFSRRSLSPSMRNDVPRMNRQTRTDIGRSRDCTFKAGVSVISWRILLSRTLYSVIDTPFPPHSVPSFPFLQPMSLLLLDRVYNSRRRGDVASKAASWGI